MFLHGLSIAAAIDLPGKKRGMRDKVQEKNSNGVNYLLNG